MSEISLLDVGLLVNIEGIDFECVEKIGEVLKFRSFDGMVFKELAIPDLTLSIATQKISVIRGKVTPSAIDTEDQEQIKVPSLVALSKKNQEIVDIRSAFVLGVLKRGITRGQLRKLAEAAIEIAVELNKMRRKGDEKIEPPSVQSLSRWIKSYQKGGSSVETLIPRSAFRECSKRIGKESEGLISEAIEEKLLNEGVGKYSEIYSVYCDKVNKINHDREERGEEKIELVDRSTLIRRILDIPSFERDAALHGVQAARTNHRVATGKLPSSFALEFVEIDHGQLDLYVIDDILMIPLGIPWLTVLRDRHTGIILGLYISFRKTSLQSIFGGVRHSITPHNRVAELWPDVSSPWPSGFGYTYVMDRGADFISPRLRLAIRHLGSDVQYCERRIAWQKGPVERYIGVTNSTLVESLPGRTYPFRKAPPGYDARSQAVLRFSTFVYLVHKWVAEVYHHKPHSRKLASPLERWSVSVAAMPVPAVPTAEALVVMTGEAHTRKISQEGLIHNWLTYTSPVLQDICNDLGRVSVQFIPNAENLGFGMAIDPRDKRTFRVECTTPEYASGLSEVQHAYIRRNTKVELRSKDAITHLMRTRNEIQETLADEILNKDSADKVRLYRAAIHAGIDSTSILNGAPRSVADLLKVAAAARKDAGVKAATEGGGAGSNDVPHFDWL